MDLPCCISRKAPYVELLNHSVESPGPYLLGSTRSVELRIGRLNSRTNLIHFLELQGLLFFLVTSCNCLLSGISESPSNSSSGIVGMVLVDSVFLQCNQTLFFEGDEIFYYSLLLVF